MGYFFVVNSTFLGIAGKTISFANLCLVLLLMLPKTSTSLARPGNTPYQAGQFKGPLPC